MTPQTIARIHDEVGDWDSQHGPLKVISGFLKDGSYWFRNVKPQNLELVLGDLKALVGKETGLVLEDAGQSKAGNQKWRLKDYPRTGGGQDRTITGSGPGPRQASKGDFRTPEQIIWNEAAHAAARLYQGTGKADEALAYTAQLFEAAPRGAIVDGAAAVSETVATKAGAQGTAAPADIESASGEPESEDTRVPAAPSPQNIRTCEKCGSTDFAPVNERGWLDCNNCGYGVKAK